jgi:Tol biopolymer transport system component
VTGPHGENARKVLASENDFYDALAWSQTGERLAYIKRVKNSSGGSVETVLLNGGTPTVVLSDGRLSTDDTMALLWLANGRMIYSVAGASSTESWDLCGITVDPVSGKPSGTSVKITNTDGIYQFDLSVSSNLRQLVLNKQHNRADVYVGDLKDKGTSLVSSRRLTVSDSRNFPSAWTSDSKAVLLASSRTGRYQLYRQFLDQDAAERLIQGSDDENGAVQSPDGK